MLRCVLLTRRVVGSTSCRYANAALRKGTVGELFWTNGVKELTGVADIRSLDEVFKHNPNLKLITVTTSWAIFTERFGPSQVAIGLEILIHNVSSQRCLLNRFSEFGKILIAGSDTIAEGLKFGLQQ